MDKNFVIPEQQKTFNEVQRVVDIFRQSEGEIRPHFWLTGPSGSGKTHIIEMLCNQGKLNYFEINGAQLTKEGTSGNSLSKALAPLQSHKDGLTICFVDEADKLFISGNSNTSSAHEVTTGVQNEFLRVLEADNTEVFGDYGKYNKVSCGNVLFIFAGAFNNEEEMSVDKLRDTGVKTEFLGRVSLIFNVTKPSLESLRSMLPELKLFKDYLLLVQDADKLHAIEAIMDVVEEMYEKNSLGVRILSSLTHQYFINGGVLNREQTKKCSFQGALTLGDMNNE